jgi:hypothetical protein
MGIERRSGDRVFVKLPLELDGGGKGLTRDVNATGVYFESDVDNAPGSEISFALEFDNLGFPKMCWKCRATVVRIEQKDGKQGIAARITDFEILTKSKPGKKTA